ncbi:MAG: SAM-dependent methyltransferase, partial [Gammaproteobacteria bacterium]|nr:SAM-dependent methyltransferase [Gammaproteobacteria bacterium]
DLIYSALAFHYIEDFAGLCRRMRARLRHAGRLVASVEHPIFSAPRRDQWLEQDEAIVWPLDSYLDEDTRVRSWFADGVIKHHRTIGTYVNTLLDSSFRLLRLVEWGPDEAQVAAHPAWARERDRPMFLLIAAQAT